MTNQFEENVKAIPSNADASIWKQALIEVADTAWLCRSWFESHNVPFTAADLMTMTGMVISLSETKRHEARTREADDE